MRKNLLALLDQHHHERDLISVRREDIDDAAIQGFVLARSRELLVLQYISDFHLEGLVFEHFSGAANWASAPAEIAWDDVTCCQVDAHYINFYARHFARQSLS